MPQIDETEFPGNSDREKQSRKEITRPSVSLNSDGRPKSVRKVKRIVKGKAIKRKKSLGSSLAKSFLGDSTRSVGSYILYEVLIPAAKSTIQDIITGGIEMLLYGESGRSRRHGSRDSNHSVVSYSSFYDKRNRREPPRPVHRAQNRRLDEIVIEDRWEAEYVLETLETMLEQYEVVSVDDLYTLVGFEKGDWTDTKFGWDDLHSARIVKVRGGYVLDLPDPIDIRD